MKEIVFTLTKACDSQGHIDAKLVYVKSCVFSLMKACTIIPTFPLETYSPHKGLRSHKEKRHGEVFLYELMVLGIVNPV